MEWIVEIFRQHFRPIEPVRVPREVLQQLGGQQEKPPWASQIRAVLFDLYGTLWISAGGAAAQFRTAPRQAAIYQALEAVGLRPCRWSAEDAEVLVEAIQTMHAERRSQGIEYPEIQIAEAWQLAITQWRNRGVLASADSVDLHRLVVECEARANPLWPMPGVEECLDRLRERGYELGVVSNAQFYTPFVFPALFQKEAAQLGFAPRLIFYSYRYGVAKPGLELFQLALQELARSHIFPWQTLFVGNDLLQDIRPAGQVGFRTALFAGDQRSLRLYPEDPRSANVKPDLVLSGFPQLAEWFAP